MSPQQPDGISNIRSWNVKNAGQSDPTKRDEMGRERGEDGGRGERDQYKKKGGIGLNEEERRIKKGNGRKGHKRLNEEEMG